ncbi:MAG: ferredoxin--NADP reductase [Burkholderiales bacterium]
MSGAKSKWLEGRVVENRHWTEKLFSLRVEGPEFAFQAGQFVKLALDVDGKRIARAFSFVNPPGTTDLEFYGVIVPGGPLSPHLARLEAGDGIFLSPNPAGFLVLREVPDGADLWMIASGTGLAPFLSILRTETPWQRYERVLLVHAVRYAAELVYRDLIVDLTRAHSQFSYVRFVSRERAAGTLEGRVPAAIRDGSLEAARGPISAERSRFMLCGNPDMVKDVSVALIERGLRKHRRRAPGHITVENFW